MVLAILQFRFMRRKDAKFVKHFPLTLATALITSVLMLLLMSTAAATTYTTTPLVTLMFALASTSQWINEEVSPRPNLLAYFLQCVPSALVCTIAAFLPPYAVAVPGVALGTENPVGYSVWCGIGFPVLSLILRILIMNYNSNFASKLVMNGDMEPSGVIPYLSTTSFTLGTSLMFGNTMLLYLSKNVHYATTSSAFAILTEVAGKVYAVNVILNKTKVKRKIKKKTRRVKAIAKGVASTATSAGDKNDGAGVTTGSSVAAAEKAEDERKQEEQLLMFSIRLHNEIIAEKVCIILGAVINGFFVTTPHSGETMALYTVIFFFTELIADAVLVYVLVEYFALPMLKLPAENFLWRSGEFWSGVVEVALVPVMGTFFFLHAFLTANEWLEK
jgi:hypothetical protein